MLDLDGTLLDTAAEIAQALAAAFEERGLPVIPRKTVETLVGRGVPSLVERALALAGAPHEPPGPMVERFEAHYARVVGTASQPYPGVVEGIELLRSGSVPLAVVTNKPRFFTEKLLAQAGLESHFAALVAGDDGIRRKPHGDMLLAACERMGAQPRQTLMLGDSDNDIVAAREAGCPVWCVPYGYNEGRGPETLACDRLVETVAHAARLLVA